MFICDLVRFNKEYFLNLWRKKEIERSFVIFLVLGIYVENIVLVIVKSF